MAAYGRFLPFSLGQSSRLVARPAEHRIWSPLTRETIDVLRQRRREHSGADSHSFPTSRPRGFFFLQRVDYRHLGIARSRVFSFTARSNMEHKETEVIGEGEAGAAEFDVPSRPTGAQEGQMAKKRNSHALMA